MSVFKAGTTVYQVRMRNEELYCNSAGYVSTIFPSMPGEKL